MEYMYINMVSCLLTPEIELVVLFYNYLNLKFCVVLLKQSLCKVYHKLITVREKKIC